MGYANLNPFGTKQKVTKVIDRECYENPTNIKGQPLPPNGQIDGHDQVNVKTTNESGNTTKKEMGVGEYVLGGNPKKILVRFQQVVRAPAEGKPMSGRVSSDLALMVLARVSSQSKTDQSDPKNIPSQIVPNPHGSLVSLSVDHVTQDTQIRIFYNGRVEYTTVGEFVGNDPAKLGLVIEELSAQTVSSNLIQQVRNPQEDN